MDYLKIGSNNMERQSINIVTQILDPQTANNDACTFLIQPTGILDKHTRIVIPIRRGASTFDGEFPLTTGAMSVLQTATLRDSLGNTIAQTDDIGHLHAKFNLHRPCDIRENVQSVKSGDCMCFGQSQKGDGGNHVEIQHHGACESGKTHLKGEDFPWHFDSVYDYNEWQGFVPDGGTGGAGNEMITGLVNPRFRCGHDLTTEFELNVSLEDLFPELFSNLLLPLHALDGALSLQLLFSRPESRFIQPRAEAGSRLTAAGANFTIQADRIRMVMDLLYYNDETMNQIKAATTGQGLPLVYGDFIAIKTTLTPPVIPAVQNPSDNGDASASKFFEFNLGLDNMVVRYMSMNLSLGNQSICTAGNADQPTSTISPANLTNEYHSCAPRLANGLECNLIVNNSPLFPSDVKFYPRQYIETQQIHGFPQYTPQSTFSYQGSIYDSYTTAQFENMAVAPANVPNVGSIGVIDQNAAFGAALTNDGICRMDIGSLVDSAGAATAANTATAYTWNEPWGWMFQQSQGSLLGGLRNIGFNLRHTRDNVSGAGMQIGNAPVSLRLRYTFSNEDVANFTTGASVPHNAEPITCITHVCAERKMVILNGEIKVSEN